MQFTSKTEIYLNISIFIANNTHFMNFYNLLLLNFRFLNNELLFKVTKSIQDCKYFTIQHIFLQVCQIN